MVFGSLVFVWVYISIKLVHGNTILPNSVVPEGKLIILAKEA